MSLVYFLLQIRVEAEEIFDILNIKRDLDGALA
jgi:hypothetical protein